MESIEKNETPNPTAASKKDYKNVIIGFLAVALLITGIYLLSLKSNTAKTIEQQQNQITDISNEKSELQSSFDASLVRLDSIEKVTKTLNTELEQKNSEISQAKNEIRSILNKKNATAQELTKAKELIASLNANISSLEAQVAKLTEDNKVLGEEKAALTVDKEKLTQDLANTTKEKTALEKEVDVASTLFASNINITPLNVKKNGKEKISENAKHVDKLLLSFDLSNRIVKNGSTDLFIVVIGPDGKPISSQNNLSGFFNTREESNKTYTAKVPVALEPSKPKNVSFVFTPEKEFLVGDYKIEIYQNGFLIGKSNKVLKKGGIFG